MSVIDLQVSSGNPLTFTDLIAGGERLKPDIQVRLELCVPKGEMPTGGWPAVVAIHGSMGFGPHHAPQLAMCSDRGIATCKVWTFKARGETNSVENQNIVPMGAFLCDAFTALDTLSTQTHAKINMSKVGIIGWSYGGTCAAYTAMEAVAAGCLKDKPTAERRAHRFAAHLVFYGGLTYTPLPGTKWTGAPMEFHCGDVENYSWYSHSVRLAKIINDSVGQARQVAKVITYPGGHHSFDRYTWETPEHVEEIALVLSEDCALGVMADGTLLVPGTSPAANLVDPEDKKARGQAPEGWEWLTRPDFKVPFEDVPKRMEAFIANPQFLSYMRRGAHIGANESLHSSLLKNVGDFFRSKLQNLPTIMAKL